MIECMSMVHSAILNRTASQYFFAERLQESVMEDPISTRIFALSQNYWNKLNPNKYEKSL